MSLDYAIYDVFTATPLEGNPLAVVFDADGLSDEAMQAIAAEFNLSETIFLSQMNDGFSAAARIFTPTTELPFAGHPTVGGAIAMVERDGLVADGRILTLDEPIGQIRAVVSDRDGSFAEFDLPQLPQRLPLDIDRAMLADALGIAAERIGFENHEPACFTGGIPYVTVPLRDKTDVGAVRFDKRRWSELPIDMGGLHLPDAYVYCRDTVRLDAHFHARMFSLHLGSDEDPATGSAAASFLGAVVEFDRPRDGDHSILIEQGVEMGRPSLMQLEFTVQDRAAATARLGGHAVKVAEGRLLV